MSSTSDEFKCPYCNVGFDTKEDLSKHIDRTHMGAGALEKRSSR
ncbi:MAG: C2H2-type zinc finger protein [Thaumarchaeota archaeon]|nr:C2H2-type zinc finger protein [Nitrososphaerota archaeon]